MNKVILIGRLTKDPEARYSQGENATCITRFSLAVNRKFKREGEPDADFLNCVAFGKTGEFVSKWFKKGNPIAVVGHIQTGSYTKDDGTKVYTTDVIVDEVEFVGSKSENENDTTTSSTNHTNVQQSPTETVAQTDSDDLPF